MAKQAIGLGTVDNDGTGDTAKVAGDKINDNFDEAYANGQGLGGTRTITGITTLTNADYGKTIRCNSASPFTLTLPTPVSGEETSAIDIVNVNDGVVTVSAGTNGINRLGNDTFTLVKDQRVTLTADAIVDPMWAAEVESALELAANEYLASDGTSAEARTDTHAIGGSVETTANGTFTLHYKTPWALTIDDVDASTKAGTCSIQITDDGAGITGFTTAVTQTTSNKNTVSGSAIAAGSTLAMVITLASALTAVNYSLNLTRTGN